MGHGVESIPLIMSRLDFVAVCSCLHRSSTPSNGILLHRLFVLAKDLCIALSYMSPLKSQILFSLS